MRAPLTLKLSALRAFRLTCADAEALARFYQALGFTLAGSQPIDAGEMRTLGLAGLGRRCRLRLGRQRLDLDSFEVPGRPYPIGTTAADLCFQHLALVTDDAALAWRRAAALGASSISPHGPVRLPPATGVAVAVKFRDPEGHPLEFLQFPPDSAGSWTGTGVLGIDHSAISVADAAGSRRFYEACGLTVGRATLNRGPTQSALDDLPAVEVEVIPMLPPEAPPHLELLGYRQPTGRPAQRLNANDVAATRIVWAADRDELLRDPDGHLHQLQRHAGA